MLFKRFPSIVIGGLSLLLASSGCAGPTRAIAQSAAIPAVDLETPAAIKTASFALG